MYLSKSLNFDHIRQTLKVKQIVACVTHLGEHILRSQGQMTYSPHIDDNDNASMDGSVTSVDTLPYNFDVCQLIDQRKKNWRDIIAKQLGTILLIIPSR